ncbi:MAG: hypothetical protein O2954_20145 [bacterium]|nr:hypothetical protein [bacterium]
MDPLRTNAKQAKTSPGIDAGILDDLQRKQELLAAACKCLEDHRYYVFFENLAELSRKSPEERELLLDSLEMMEEYNGHELGVIRRLVTGDGAAAFKDLVEVVREIRIEREIEGMLGKGNFAE